MIYILYFIDTKNLGRYWNVLGKFSSIVLIGSFMSLMYVLGFGIENLLLAIPGDWGRYDEAGELGSTSRYVAYFLAFWSSLFFVKVFSKFENLISENRELDMELEILKEENCQLYKKQPLASNSNLQFGCFKLLTK